MKGLQLEPAGLFRKIRTRAEESSEVSPFALEWLMIRARHRACICVQRIGPETLLRVRNPLQCSHRHLELAIAKSTDSDDRDGTEPFNDPEISFLLYPRATDLRLKRRTALGA